VILLLVGVPGSGGWQMILVLQQLLLEFLHTEQQQHSQLGIDYHFCAEARSASLCLQS
jgi:hypothetical protein